MKDYKETNLVKVAEKFLIGDGPSIIIIPQQNNLSESIGENSSEEKDILSFIKNNFDANFLFYCFHDISIDFNKKRKIENNIINPSDVSEKNINHVDSKNKSIVVSGIRPTQASLICKKFGINSFFHKNEFGLWSSHIEKMTDKNPSSSTYMMPYATLDTHSFLYCYQQKGYEDTVCFSFDYQNSRSSIL